MFPAPPEPLKLETEENFELQVVKTRIPSAKKSRVVCSPGNQMSVVKITDTSLQTAPLSRSNGDHICTVEAFQAWGVATRAPGVFFGSSLAHAVDRFL